MGAACPLCGRFPGSGGACPRCGKRPSNVIDFTQRLRERQFAAALARHLRPGWRLLCDPAFEPDCIAFLSHFPDVLFAGRDAYAALAPRVAELGGKLAVPRALP